MRFISTAVKSVIKLLRKKNEENHHHMEGSHWRTNLSSQPPDDKQQISGSPTLTGALHIKWRN